MATYSIDVQASRTEIALSAAFLVACAVGGYLFGRQVARRWV